MPVASSGVTPDRFAAVMRRLETVAPVELNDALVDVGRRVVLPRAKTRAPHKSGRLAGSLSVVPGGLKGAAFKSPLVYAWAQHGAPQPGAANSQTWYAISRVGRNRRPPGRGIRKSLYVTGSIESEQAGLNRAIGEELDRMMLKHLGGA